MQSAFGPRMCERPTLVQFAGSRIGDRTDMDV